MAFRLRPPPLLSVFDLGSNSFQLLLAERRADGLVGVHRDTVFNNISSDVGKDGAISDAGMQRALIAVQKLISRAPSEAHRSRVVALATHAIREASNGKLLLEKVAATTGLKAKIISGEQAATLAFLGATAEFPSLKDKRFTVADIGGGSTEIAWGTPGTVQRAISVRLGITALVGRLAQMPNTANIALDHLAVFIRRTLESAVINAAEEPPQVLVFASGVARVIGRLAVSYGFANPGESIDTRALRELIPILLAASRSELLARGVPEERVVTVGPTAVAVEVVRELFEMDTFLIAQGGLRDGAAMSPDMIGVQNWPKVPKAKRLL